MLMKSKNKVLNKENWEAIIAQPNPISKLTLGKLFLLNKKYVEQKYGFTHIKGNNANSLQFYEEVVIPREFGDIALEENELVSNEISIESMNETESKGSSKREDQTDTSGMFDMEELKNSLCKIVLPLGTNSDEKKRKVNESQLNEIMKFTSLFDCNGFCSISDYAELLKFACNAYKQRKCVKQSRSPFSLLLLLVKTVVIKSIHDAQNKMKEKHLRIHVNTMKDLIETEVSMDTSLLQSNSQNIELYVRAFASVNFEFAFSETSNGPVKFTQLFGGNLKRSVKTAQNNCKELKYVEENEVMVRLLQKLHVLDEEVALVDNVSSDTTME